MWNVGDQNTPRIYLSRGVNARDDWETPKYFFDLLNEIFGFTLDAAASHSNHKCDKYYTIQEDGILQDWEGETAFCNPPFNEISMWVKKCYSEGQKKDTTVVMICPVRSDTDYWHEYIMKAHEVWFVNKRVNFLRDGKEVKGSTFPLCVIVFKRTLNKTPKIRSFDHK